MDNLQDSIKEPYTRKIIIVVDQATMADMETNEEGRELLANQEILVLPIEEWDQYKDKFRILGDARPSIGSYYILSPNDDYLYAELLEARNLFSVEKNINIVELCHLLGAKSIKILSIRIEDMESQKKIECKLDASAYLIDGELNSERILLNKIKNNIELEVNFEGGRCDVEKAEQMLEKNYLNDSILRKLVRMKRNEVDGGNKIKDFSLSISLTDSLQKTFDLIANVDFPTSNFNTKYQSLVKEKIDISISLKINFS